MQSKRCVAKCRTRNYQPCRSPAVIGGTRCRMHGGRSTGPTAEGRLRLKKANTKHGRYSKEILHNRRIVRELVREGEETLSGFKNI